MSRYSAEEVRAHRQWFMVAAMLLIVAAFIIGTRLQYAVDSAADITVAPCSAWADTSHPDLPPFTFEGACVDDNGELVGP